MSKLVQVKSKINGETFDVAIEKTNTYVLRKGKVTIEVKKDNYIPIFVGLPIEEVPISKEKENVNHPNHYQGKIEVIDYLDDKLGEHAEGFYIGNVIKYVSRYKGKNGLEDLDKAFWYLNRLIKLKKGDNVNE